MGVWVSRLTRPWLRRVLESYPYAHTPTHPYPPGPRVSASPCLRVPLSPCHAVTPSSCPSCSVSSFPSLHPCILFSPIRIHPRRVPFGRAASLPHAGPGREDGEPERRAPTRRSRPLR